MPKRIQRLDLLHPAEELRVKPDEENPRNQNERADLENLCTGFDQINMKEPDPIPVLQEHYKNTVRALHEHYKSLEPGSWGWESGPWILGPGAWTLDDKLLGPGAWSLEDEDENEPAHLRSLATEASDAKKVSE